MSATMQKHPTKVREMLKRAGASEGSELTDEQLARAKSSRAADFKSKDGLYGFIFRGEGEQRQSRGEAGKQNLAKAKAKGNGQPAAKSSGRKTATKAAAKKSEKSEQPKRRRSKYSQEDRELCEGAMLRANKRAGKPMRTKIRPRELALVRKGLGKRSVAEALGLSKADAVSTCDGIARALPSAEVPEPLTALVKKVGDPIVRPRLAAAVLAELAERS